MITYGQYIMEQNKTIQKKKSVYSKLKLKKLTNRKVTEKNFYNY